MRKIILFNLFFLQIFIELPAQTYNKGEFYDTFEYHFTRRRIENVASERIRLLPGFHGKVLSEHGQLRFRTTIDRSSKKQVQILPTEEHFKAPSTVVTDLLNYNLSYPKDIPLIGFTIPYDNYTQKFCFEYDAAGNYIGINVKCGQVKLASVAELNVVESLDILSDLIQIAPNPTRDKINIYWDRELAQKIVTINIYSLGGLNHHQIKFDPNHLNSYFDLSSYPKGIHFIEFILQGGQKLNKKIIKL